MRIYHVTTLNRWESIKVHGLVPGGLDMSEADIAADQEDREYAGDLYCADSADVVCLTLQPDGRYGGVVLRIDIDGLEADKFSYLSGDAWDDDSRRFSTFAEAVDDNLNRRDYGDLYYAERGVEIRYAGTIPPELIKRVNYSWGK